MVTLGTWHRIKVIVKRTASTSRTENAVNFQKINILEGSMHYSKEEKTRLLEGWEQSGKSISAYVKDQGLVRRTFTKWLKAARETETKADFVEAAGEHIRGPHDMPEILIEKREIKIRIPLATSCNELRTVLEWLGAVL